MLELNFNTEKLKSKFSSGKASFNEIAMYSYSIEKLLNRNVSKLNGIK